MRESEIEKKLCRLAVQAGGKAYKFVSPGNTGVPDRIVILPGGKVGFIELKRQGEVPRKQQRLRREELESLGCYTAVVDSVEAAQAVLTQIRMQTPRVCDTDSLFRGMINRGPGRKGVIL